VEGFSRLNPEHPITPLESNIAWSCPWYHVRQDRILLPNGSEGIYNVVDMRDGVWVLPVTTEGEVVLLRTYRYPLKTWTWELPSGGVEVGDETLETAKRELAEEAGGTAADWRFLMQVSPLAGVSTLRAHLFLAAGVTLGDTHHEATEVMTVHRMPVQEAVHMARSGQIEDAVSALALLLVEGKI
jgi:ADP-ribose pyrophosphatase